MSDDAERLDPRPRRRVARATGRSLRAAVRRLRPASPTVGSAPPTPPLPEPDLSSRDRARNAGLLVEVAAQLDQVADVAGGKVVREELATAPEWLRNLAAPAHDAPPADPIVRWLELFTEELDAVWRARNTVKWQQWISDGNVAAAAQMAERLLRLAEVAGGAVRG